MAGKNKFLAGCILVGAMTNGSHSMGQEKTSPIINQNVNSYNQSGGITAHTLNIGPTPRKLSDPRSEGLKAQILRELPRDKPITVIAVLGDGEAIQFAQEIHAFMKAQGFTMKEPNGISQSVFSGVVKGLVRQDKPDGGIDFIIGANLQ